MQKVFVERKIMEQTLKIFEYSTSKKIRTVQIDGEIWFVAKDVCEILELVETARKT